MLCTLNDRWESGHKFGRESISTKFNSSERTCSTLSFHNAIRNLQNRIPGSCAARSLRSLDATECDKNSHHPGRRSRWSTYPACQGPAFSSSRRGSREAGNKRKRHSFAELEGGKLCTHRYRARIQKLV